MEMINAALERQNFKKNLDGIIDNPGESKADFTNIMNMDTIDIFVSFIICYNEVDLITFSSKTYAFFIKDSDICPDMNRGKMANTYIIHLW
jgi:hypothetical protein